MRFIVVFWIGLFNDKYRSVFLGWIVLLDFFWCFVEVVDFVYFVVCLFNCDLYCVRFVLFGYSDFVFGVKLVFG